jgi:arsenate reductase-like glutaredoxin family protein
MSSIRLYGKPRCSLCDHAKEALTKAGVQFDEVDITSDPALMQEFGVFIPVVEVDGTIVFEAGMDPAGLPDLVSGG